MKHLFLTLIAVCFFGVAHAEPAHVKKSTTTVTTTESEGEEDVAEAPGATATPAGAPTEDFLITSIFGSKATTGTSGCKTEELAKHVVADLQAQCSKWMTARKKELKNKYQAGTCDESCEDCGMSLQRCTVKGVVHYAK